MHAHGLLQTAGLELADHRHTPCKDLHVQRVDNDKRNEFLGKVVGPRNCSNSSLGESAIHLECGPLCPDKMIRTQPSRRSKASSGCMGCFFSEKGCQARPNHRRPRSVESVVEPKDIALWRLKALTSYARQASKSVCVPMHVRFNKCCRPVDRAINMGFRRRVH